MRNKQNIRFQWLLLGTAILLTSAKFAAFIITHSDAILTDAAESIVNVLAASLGLYSLMLAAKPKDIDHPYGHGKVEFISASVEGGMIIMAGLVIVIKSIYSLFVPHEIHSLDLGIYLIVSSGILNFLVGFIVERKGIKNNSLVLISGGKHLQSDAYSTAGLVVGLMLLYVTSWRWLDSAVAMLFGGIIIVTGYKILRKSISGIMDETDTELIDTIIQTIGKNRSPNLIDVHNMRAIKYGEMLHIDCHITVPYYFTVEQAHKEIEAIDQWINQHFENRVEFFIHTDPCEVNSCAICTIQHCPVRKQPFQKNIPWTLETILKNQKHQL
ncbi:MAG: cation diffusion facilitator family transporter [Flavobacteriales bacterium]|nr:cation diffusion facilitator family transporter [Flavobacteriales bacterium]